MIVTEDSGRNEKGICNGRVERRMSPTGARVEDGCHSMIGDEVIGNESCRFSPDTVGPRRPVLTGSGD